MVISYRCISYHIYMIWYILPLASMSAMIWLIEGGLLLLFEGSLHILVVCAFVLSVFVVSVFVVAVISSYIGCGGGVDVAVDCCCIDGSTDVVVVVVVAIVGGGSDTDDVVIVVIVGIRSSLLFS